MKTIKTIKHSSPSIDRSDIESVNEVLSSGNLTQGVKVEEFEEIVGKFVGVKYGIALSSGTAALHLALKGLNVGPGDEVIIPSYVCASPYIATLHAGAIPKIVDIGLTDFNINSEEIEKNLTNNTKAIIVPHMFGTPADLDEILSLGIPIIEDCALSLGAEYKGSKVGSFGKASICSFYATKMIATGEGGMVLTNDDDVYATVSELRQYDGKNLSKLRYNYKITDFQAALGISQMNKLPTFISRRREIAKIYDDFFSKIGAERQKISKYKQSVFYRYVVLLNEMEEIQRQMKQKGVACEKPVYMPLHESLTLKNFPKTDYIYNHALSFPTYPSLNKEEIDYIVEMLELVFQVHSSRT